MAVMGTIFVKKIVFTGTDSLRTDPIDINHIFILFNFPFSITATDPFSRRMPAQTGDIDIKIQNEPT